MLHWQAWSLFITGWCVGVCMQNKASWNDVRKSFIIIVGLTKCGDRKKTCHSFMAIKEQCWQLKYDSEINTEGHVHWNITVFRIDRELIYRQPYRRKMHFQMIAIFKLIKNGTDGKQQQQYRYNNTQTNWLFILKNGGWCPGCCQTSLNFKKQDRLWTLNLSQLVHLFF